MAGAGRARHLLLMRSFCRHRLIRGHVNTGPADIRRIPGLLPVNHRLLAASLFRREFRIRVRLVNIPVERTPDRAIPVTLRIDGRAELFDRTIRRSILVIHIHRAVALQQAHPLRCTLLAAAVDRRTNPGTQVRDAERQRQAEIRIRRAGNDRPFDARWIAGAGVAVMGIGAAAPGFRIRRAGLAGKQGARGSGRGRQFIPAGDRDTVLERAVIRGVAQADRLHVGVEMQLPLALSQHDAAGGKALELDDHRTRHVAAHAIADERVILFAADNQVGRSEKTIVRCQRYGPLRFHQGGKCLARINRGNGRRGWRGRPSIAAGVAIWRFASSSSTAACAKDSQGQYTGDSFHGFRFIYKR